MARRVDEFPDFRAKTTYPWDEWLDGGVWELVPGEDFQGTIATFRSNAIGQAKRRGGRVRTRRQEDADGRNERFYIQFYREDEAP